MGILPCKICPNLTFLGPTYLIIVGQIQVKPVMYPGRLGAWYTSLGTQTLVPKKGFLTIYLKIFFKHPQRRVFHYSISVIWKMCYKEQARSGSAFLEHLEAQGLKKTLDMSLETIFNSDISW